MLGGVEGRADRCHRGRQLLVVGGSPSRKRSVRRTQPMSKDTAWTSPPVAVADLRGPAADVEDDDRAVAPGEPGGGPRIRQRDPPPGRSSSSAATPIDLRRRRGGSPPRWRRPAPPMWPRAAPDRTPRRSMMARNARRAESVRSMASGCSRRLASTPCPRRVIASRGRALARRVRRPADGWSWSRSRARRPRGRCRSPPCLALADPWSRGQGTGCGAQPSGRVRPSCTAAQAPTGSSPPASHHATWACRHLTPWRVPPTPPLGRGPDHPAGTSASRAAA